jgi:hypothetical protein
MPGREVWKLRVWYDARHDFVGVTFEGSALTTPESVGHLAKEFLARMRTFDQVQDLLVEYDGIAVAPELRSLFSGARLQVGDKVGSRIYRVGSSESARELFAPQGLGPSAGVVLYPDRETAIAAMLEERRLRNARPKLAAAS